MNKILNLKKRIIKPLIFIFNEKFSCQFTRKAHQIFQKKKLPNQYHIVQKIICENRKTLLVYICTSYNVANARHGYGCFKCRTIVKYSSVAATKQNLIL